MSPLHEVEISALPMERLRAVIGEDRLRSWQAVAAAARESFAGRTVWNVNSRKNPGSPSITNQRVSIPAPLGPWAL